MAQTRVKKAKTQHTAPLQQETSQAPGLSKPEHEKPPSHLPTPKKVPEKQSLLGRYPAGKRGADDPGANVPLQRLSVNPSAKLLNSVNYDAKPRTKKIQEICGAEFIERVLEDKNATEDSSYRHVDLTNYGLDTRKFVAFMIQFTQMVRTNP
ncbi:hypothetical protein SLS60_006195 [Paraconiothyrium brasiliense]|uniref:Uncharacterized protein n=1 Tax=Paraconiothyrium brasiliense TaxID=300254 RepID=A0ABR3RF65_9PLEO